MLLLGFCYLFGGGPVVKKDAESSKSAFVVSASALEKWSTLTGLSEQIKGL